LESATASLIKQEVAKPLDPNELAALSDSPATAAEIYWASVLIVNDENELEKITLHNLPNTQKFRLIWPCRLKRKPIVQANCLCRAGHLWPVLVLESRRGLACKKITQ
jgi:uncharacterized protein YjhX (UPF0386 family)